MRVVLEHDNGEIWGQHEIEGAAADHLLEALSGPPKSHRRGRQAAASLVEDLRAGSLAEIARRQETDPPTTTVDFTRGELILLHDALEAYWFDCTQGENEDLAARVPAVEALNARIEQVLQRPAPLPTDSRSPPRASL